MNYHDLSRSDHVWSSWFRTVSSILCFLSSFPHDMIGFHLVFFLVAAQSLNITPAAQSIQRPKAIRNAINTRRFCFDCDCMPNIYIYNTVDEIWYHMIYQMSWGIKLFLKYIRCAFHNCSSPLLRTTFFSAGFLGCGFTVVSPCTVAPLKEFCGLPGRWERGCAVYLSVCFQ